MIINPYNPNQFYVGAGINSLGQEGPEKRETETIRKNDPFRLRAKYIGNQEVISILDVIEQAVEKSNETGTLDLSNTDLSNLSGLRLGTYSVNLERLILATGAKNQYPLSGADLSCANLSYANLSYTNLSYTDLSNINLPYADLSCANLSYANLSYTDLSGTNLFCTNLSNTNLSGAFILQDTKKIAGEELRRYLIENYKVSVNKNTRF
ncbi:MAG: hypothetical protein A3I68_00445 [Candidatus Melainabacteria bacterium RIFCSPLOWO2_02_FULL_35_15]|nr:MAG: hypothetical protein A3F80_05780 [Candidatus Melainabacteria bacterium RIFCSPLOWO2_12_FULL_35_11]OGI14880.1 MAG: hypothetical protein A3I68_00445 [Candidatus Melainabacteria bacterium RIFCSPLOWO2_02_FULL_35_15]